MDKKVRTPGAAVALALALCACGTEHVDDFGGVLDLAGIADGGLAQQFNPQTGYVGAKKMEYYDFGEARSEVNKNNVVVGAPTSYMYWFYARDSYNRQAHTGQPLAHLTVDDQGKPVLDDSQLANLDDPDNPCQGQVTNRGAMPTSDCEPPRVQHPIVDTIPGRPDYTPFWEVAHVLVPANYPIDSIKSRRTLEDAGLEIVYPGIAINCPVVDETASLIRGVAGHNRFYARLRFWFRRMLGTCFLVEGGDQVEVGLLAQPGVAPPFPVIHEVVGNRKVLQLYPRDIYIPTWVEKVGMNTIKTSAVPDNLIAGALPGDDRYSPFVQENTVTVPPAYTQGTFTSLAQIDSSLITATGTYKDMPIAGAVPPCPNGQRDCDPYGLTCDTSTGFCTTPPVGFSSPCGPGLALCKLERSNFFPDGLSCWKRRDNKHGNCYMGCDPSLPDNDPSDTIDTRCNSVPGLRCIRAFITGCPNGQPPCSYTNHGGACIKYCNAAKDDPMQCATDDYMNGGSKINYTQGQVCIQTAIEACSWKDDYKPMSMP
ncbi:MAG TPA: hypothetical protein VKN99_04750 [Polyangia bacterium]|nr:hypothetical protein [Polyangia bacterium]